MNSLFPNGSAVPVPIMDYEECDTPEERAFKLIFAITRKQYLGSDVTTESQQFTQLTGHDIGDIKALFSHLLSSKKQFCDGLLAFSREEILMFMRAAIVPIDEQQLIRFIKRNVVHGLQEGDYAMPLTFADAAALCKVVEYDTCPEYITQLFREKVQQGPTNIQE